MSIQVEHHTKKARANQNLLTFALSAHWDCANQEVSNKSIRLFLSMEVSASLAVLLFSNFSPGVAATCVWVGRYSVPYTVIECGIQRPPPRVFEIKTSEPAYSGQTMPCEKLPGTLCTYSTFLTGGVRSQDPSCFFSGLCP